MSAADGHVDGVTKIVDHGSNSERFNVVVLGDGYTVGQLEKYHADVQTFLSAFRATSPFDRLWCAINVHRVDVVSTDAGAEKPTACGGDGATRQTFFDGKYCADGAIERLLTVDTVLALDTARAQVPEAHFVFVAVNDTVFGGSGDADVAVFATNATSINIALHEMGHSAFGLADEYESYAGCQTGETGHDAYAGVEPAEPNVTAETNQATIPWRDLIDPATPVPTTVNADCSICDPQPSPVAAGVIGLFEGARWFHCGLFRPAFDCKMRTEAAPRFCSVCAHVITTMLAVYMPFESITLTTPSLSFADIPEGFTGGAGVKASRAIVFEVVTCDTRTLRITSPVLPPLDTPSGLSVVVGPASTEPLATALLWVDYTSGVDGDQLSQTLTVACDETGETWAIDVHANTVKRQAAGLVLVLDRSASMGDPNAEGTPKSDMLRRAAGLLVDVMLEGDALAIVRFADTADRILDMIDVGPEGGGAGRAAAMDAIIGSQLDPAGDTGIGAGLLAADDAFAASSSGLEPFDVEAVLVMTDGKENRDPRIADVAELISANTFAVGLGAQQDVDVDTLAELTLGLNGYLLLTGGIDADQETRLEKYFLQILAGIENAEVVLDPRGALSSGGPQRIPFVLTEADYGADVLLLTPHPELIDFRLRAPDGTALDPSVPGAGVKIVTDRVAYYRFPLPVPIASTAAHGGRWYAELELNAKGQRFLRSTSVRSGRDATIVRRGAMPYDLVVHTYSGLRFTARLTPSVLEAGGDVRLTARIRENDAPPQREATVFADVDDPDGRHFTVRLQHLGDGHYASSFAAHLSGLYALRVRADGTSLDGLRYTRERTLVASVSRRAGRREIGPFGSPEILRSAITSVMRGARTDRPTGAEMEALQGLLPREPHRRR